MKMPQIFSSILAAAALTFSSCSDGEPSTPQQPDPDPVIPVKETGFARGADVSWLTQMESEGLRFYTPAPERREMELMALLRDYCGVNSIRLRVWVNPADGWNSTDDVVAKARRAEALGLRTMIDFHFSDTWADPGNQKMPEAWKGLSFDGLKASVTNHVDGVLKALKNAGVTPEWVQIGNETTPGMMLPAGSVDNPAQLTALNNAGYDAVKAVFPEAKVIVHLDAGNDRWRYDRMFGLLEDNGGKYDMIGMSLYPLLGRRAGAAWRLEKDCRRLCRKHLVSQRALRPTGYDMRDRHASRQGRTMPRSHRPYDDYSCRRHLLLGT